MSSLLKVSLIFCILITMVSGQYAAEEDLIARRQVMDRKKPYKKFKKYIECQVCDLASQSIYRIWLMTMNEDKFDENEMYTLVVETCNPWSNIGVWITAMDMILNDESRLELINKEEMGLCGRECETIRSVCADIIASEAEVIAEYVWHNQNEMDNPTLTKFMCENVCGDDPEDLDVRMPKVPKKLAKKSKIGQEEWVKMTEEEKQKRIKIFNEIMEENKQERAKHDL